MNSFSLTLEILVAMVTLVVAVFATHVGRREGLGEERGWRLILGGFWLLFLGTAVDVTDHFQQLSPLIVLGPTPQQAVLEKLVGFLGGFSLMAVGLYRWLPNIAARRRAEQSARRSQGELEARVTERTAELTAKTRELEREIRERKRAEADLMVVKEAAEEASRTKSRFLANMSHELRSPLNSVIGFANILAKNPDQRLTDKELRYLDRIRANGEHLLALIDDVLVLAKTESGRQEPVYRSVDPKRLVIETLAQLKGDVDTSRVDLVARLPESCSTVRADALKFKQVLINLVSNAFKFTSEGQVVVRLIADPDTGVPLRIDVEDTGMGIPEEEQEAIFEAFRQGEASSAQRPGGTGLGLSISRSLCELMGFRLRVQSVLEEGSTFSIYLSPDAPEYDGLDQQDSEELTTSELDLADLADL
ncbi:MAG: ATP-binding protein [Acidobacteriota bacterium]|nr:ATP-binding protein [Acidobacteriota bacterium]